MNKKINLISENKDNAKLIIRDYYNKNYMYSEYIKLDYLFLISKKGFDKYIKKDKNYNYLGSLEKINFRKKIIKDISEYCHNYIVKNSEYFRKETDEYIKNFYGKLIAFINKTQETKKGCYYLHNFNILNRIKEVMYIMDIVMDFKINHEIQLLTQKGIVNFNKKGILYKYIIYKGAKTKFNMKNLFKYLRWLVNNVINLITKIDYNLKNNYTFLSYFDLKLMYNLKLEFKNMGWLGL